MGCKCSSTWAMVTDSTSSVAVGAEDRVRGVDGHAHARQLVLVDLVAAALGQGLHQADDLDPGLQGVVAGDQADVAAADDEEPSGRADQIAVDQGLEGAGAVDAGQGVALEGQRFLARPGGDQQDLGRDQDVVLPSRRTPTLSSLNTASAVDLSQTWMRRDTRCTSFSSLVAMSMPRVPA